jgi:hypothetical protein
MKARRRAASRGDISMSMIGAIAALSVFIIGIGATYKETLVSTRAMALAKYLDTAQNAAKTYMDANREQIIVALQSGGYLTVTPTGVTSSQGGSPVTGAGANGLTPYLPVALGQTFYGQSVALYVYAEQFGALGGVLATTGGTPVTGSAEMVKEYTRVAMRAASLSALGMKRATNLAGQATDSATGPANSWQVNFDDASYGNIPGAAIANGELVAAFATGGAISGDDVLYRVAVDGRPDLNAMRTDLHLDGFNIDNVGTLTITQNPVGQSADVPNPVPNGGNGLVIAPMPVPDGADNAAGAATTICTASNPAKPDGFIFTIAAGTSGGQTADDLNGIWMCLKDKDTGAPEARLIYDSVNSSATRGSTLVQNGEIVEKPVCPTNTVPTIFLSTSSFSRGQDTGPVLAVQTLANDVDAGHWKVTIRVKTTRETLGNDYGAGDASWADLAAVGAQSYNYALAMTTCERANNSTL